MKLLIAVHNLEVKKARLMPWRTVIEVADHLNRSGHDVRLISLGSRVENLDADVFPQSTFEIRKTLKYIKSDLQNILKDFNPEIIFWPVTWRESKERTRIVQSMNIPVVGWFPGGVYSARSIWLSIIRMTLKDVLPYAIESLCIGLSKIGLLKQPQFDAVIAMTETTADKVKNAGWPNIKSYVIPPGKENKDPVATGGGPKSPFVNWLDGRPYFLFMGPPNRIRGIYELLQAFESAADQNRRICLVCLFRSDSILDEENIKARIKKMRLQDRIFCIWKSLSADELNVYIQNCHATIMPFLLVPSEIPLAIIETMAWGKPVITTSPGGTGDFVRPFGAAPKTGDIKELGQAMLDFADNEILYQQKCFDTITAYKAHPDWDMMSQKWLDVAKNVLSGSK